MSIKRINADRYPAFCILTHKIKKKSILVVYEKNDSWQIPGGKNELDEKYAWDTAIRELKEETGISVEDSYISKNFQYPQYINDKVNAHYFLSKIKINNKNLKKVFKQRDEKKMKNIGFYFIEGNYIVDINNRVWNNPNLRLRDTFVSKFI